MNDGIIMNNNITRESNSFQYHIYVTMGCSLSCSHCFISDDVKKDKTPITVGDFKTIVDKYAKHFAESDAEKAELTIIGGEPLTLPPSFYTEVIPYLRDAFEKIGKFFYISLVTNLLHFSALKKIHHLFDYISTSYEPERFLYSDQEKEKVWLDNVRKSFELGIQLSLSIVTTRMIVEQGNSFLDSMLGLGFKKMQINLSVPEGELLKDSVGSCLYDELLLNRIDELKKPLHRRKPIKGVTANSNPKSIFPGFEKETEFMISATEWLVSQRKLDSEVDVYPISSYCTSTFNKKIVDDIACCANKGLNARVDGEVSGCATEIGSENIYSYGNILKEDIHDIVNSEKAKTYKRNICLVKRNCLACNFFDSCNGGCMLRAKMWDPKNKDAECHGLKGFFQYIKDNEEKLKEIDLFT